MARNEGDVDRAARVLLGGALAIPVLAQGLSGLGTVATIVGVVAIYLMVSGLMGWDPFYAVLRVSTRSPNDVNPPAPPNS